MQFFKYSRRRNHYLWCCRKESFKPVGVYDIAQLEKTVASKLRKQLVPPNTCVFYRVEYGGHDILVIEVPGLPASQRPARIGKDYYVRVGDGDHLMDEYEVTLMLSQRERRNYDAEPVEYTSPQNLDSELADSYVHSVRRVSARITSAIENEQVLKRKRVIALGDGEKPDAGGALRSRGLSPTVLPLAQDYRCGGRSRRQSA